VIEPDVLLERLLVEEQFRELVNMSAAELRDWLATDESLRVGWKGADGSLHESVGHASGRWIADILDKDERQLTDDDYAHMRKVIGYIRRHRAQEPANMVTSRWRYSLMNWGHDPLKYQD
jgi:predicted NAD/FAD-dependent oxidoreductase